jgi:hypothetical protein
MEQFSQSLFQQVSLGETIGIAIVVVIILVTRGAEINKGDKNKDSWERG